MDQRQLHARPGGGVHVNPELAKAIEVLYAHADKLVYPSKGMCRAMNTVRLALDAEGSDALL